MQGDHSLRTNLCTDYGTDSTGLLYRRIVELNASSFLPFQFQDGEYSRTGEIKKQIKSWNGAECTCRLCRTFIP